MKTKLSYDQWLEKYGGKLRDKEFQAAKDMEEDFMKFHKLNIHDEIDTINQSEYQLYLQRFEAGLEE